MGNLEFDWKEFIQTAEGMVIYIGWLVSGLPSEYAGAAAMAPQLFAFGSKKDINDKFKTVVRKSVGSAIKEYQKAHTFPEAGENDSLVIDPQDFREKLEGLFEPERTLSCFSENFSLSDEIRKICQDRISESDANALSVAIARNMRNSVESDSELSDFAKKFEDEETRKKFRHDVQSILDSLTESLTKISVGVQENGSKLDKSDKQLDEIYKIAKLLEEFLKRGSEPYVSSGTSSSKDLSVSDPHALFMDRAREMAQPFQEAFNKELFLETNYANKLKLCGIYVSPHFSDLNQDGSKKQCQEGKKPNYDYENFDKMLEAKLENGRGGPLLIEGAPGLGKSSLVMKLAARYLGSWASEAQPSENQSSENQSSETQISETQTLGCEVSCSETPVLGIFKNRPVFFIRGNTFQDSQGNPREDIRKAIIKDSEGYPRDELRQILGDHGLQLPPNSVVILDGYDEISFPAENAEQNNSYVRKLLECTDFLLIITSRPNYIRSFRGGSRVAMLDFYEDQRNEFLEKFNAGRKEEKLDESFIERLKEITDDSGESDESGNLGKPGKQEDSLLEIISIPMLLYLICASKIEDIGKIESRFDLYEAVFSRENPALDVRGTEEKTESLNFWEDAYRLAEGIAVQMYRTNIYNISAGEILDALDGTAESALAQSLGGLDKESQKRMGNRFAMEIFMTRKDQTVSGDRRAERYEFVHKSIAEYFAAKWICEKLRGILEEYLRKDTSVPAMIPKLGEVFICDRFERGILDYIRQNIENEALPFLGELFGMPNSPNDENLQKLNKLLNALLKENLCPDSRENKKKPFYELLENRAVWIFDVFMMIAGLYHRDEKHPTFFPIDPYAFQILAKNNINKHYFYARGLYSEEVKDPEGYKIRWDLSGAYLSGAYLRGAYFIDRYLGSADFSNVKDMTDMKVYRRDLKGVNYDKEKWDSRIHFMDEPADK